MNINDAWSEFWENYESDFAGDVKAKEVVRLVRKYICGRVLDVGAGSGALVDLLPWSTGVDIAPKRNEIVKASISNLPFKDGYFGTVFATDVLEHLDDDTLRQGLQEIHRVLT